MTARPTAPGAPHTAPHTAADRAFEHVLGKLFDGTLRTGDQVDLEAVRHELGCSKIPVREAVIRLERDGILDIRYRRDVVVAPFGPDAIADHFAIHGAVAGIASARLAASRPPDTLALLSALYDALVAERDAPRFYDVGVEFRRAIDASAGSTRLHRMLQRFSTFVPSSFRLLVEESRLPTLLDPIHTEYAAIVAGDPLAARAASERNLAVAGEEVVRILRARGVFGS